MGMHRFQETRTIAGRSPEEVFRYIEDPDNGPEWVGSAQEVRAEGEPGLGRKIYAKAGLMGVGFEVEQRVTAYEPFEHYAFAGDTPFHSTFDFALAEAGEDTALTATLEVDPGKFFPVGGKLIARQFKKQFVGDLDRLKKNLER